MRSLSLLLILCSLCCGAAAANVVWYDGQHPVTYQLTGKPAPVVQQALRMFADDMQLVTGHKAVAAKTAPIRIVQGCGSDDGFSIRVQNGQLVIEGHNARGTAYGILELSRMAEVSPWVWWGDVRPHTRYYPISVPDTFRLEHTPSVAYRGIFINDEDWSLRRWSPDNMGPQTYRRLFELMLRLRANTLWPAMHDVSPGFYTVKGNKEMADSFGIVIGTSHCEPLLRNNVAEWDVKQRGAYNYITNGAEVRRYWADRLQQVKGSDVLLTLGMRGIHDGSMEGVKTPEEKLNGLQQVIDDQRQLISKHYNKHVERVPQVFIPYKEVLEIMESGLRVPDDVTLMWCDDNYGYLTRLPDAEQQKRQGGGGVYYHLSYWGRPHDYLWLTTTQPGLIYTEMRAAYDHNCRRLWIANVHDPKVAAYQLELFLDMAWDINSIVSGEGCLVKGEGRIDSAQEQTSLHPSPFTLHQHYERWLMTQFGGQVGRAIAPAMREFIHLNAIRRPEFMGWTQVELDKKKYPGGKSVPTNTEFSLAEAYKRMEAFARIEATVETYRPLVMEARQDAYFAHVLYPVHAAAAMTRKMLSNEEDSRRAYEQIQQLTERYNTMNGGKWRGLMSAAPRDLPVFGETRTQLPQHPSVGSYIASNAYSPTPGPSPEGRGIAAIQMLGHSMNAVAIPKGCELTYEFETPLPPGEGPGERLFDAVLYTAMIPTQPSDRGDLRYSVQIDDQQPVVISLKEPYRSERWKQNVLRGQALKKTPVKVSKGWHTLRIKALDDHIIFDQWMLDFCPDRQFYVIPVTLHPSPFTNIAGVRTVTVFKAGDATDHYANGAVMTAFKGKLYCMWQSSPTDEDSDDTWVAYSVSADEGYTWSKPRPLSLPSGDFYCTSGGWLARGDTLTAFINTWQRSTIGRALSGNGQKAPEPRGGRTCYITSTDGQTWSQLQPVTMADGTPMEGVLEQDPYTLPGGRLVGAAHFKPGLHVCPVYTDDPKGVSGWRKASFESEDLGQQSRELEPSQYMRPDGTLVMLFRDQQGSFRKLAAMSTDRGATWTKPVVTSFPDARTKQCAGNLPGGTSFMVSCPSGDKRRWPLVLQLSRDGIAFDKTILLRSGSPDDLPQRRYEGRYKTIGYNYPKAMTHNGCLYVSYSTNKEDVECSIIPLSLTAQSQKYWDNGRLRVTDNQRFLQFENGEPFFWLGETAWLMPERLNREEVDYYLRTCHEAEYNMVQVQVLNDVPSFNAYGVPSHDKQGHLLTDTLNSYWSHLDYIIDVAAQNDIYIGMVCIWGGLVKGGKLNVEQAKTYGRFLANRYKDRPNIIWIMGGDIQGDIKPEVWETLATTIKSIDKNHLMTYHPRGRYTSAHWWSKASWIDFHTFQSGHRRYGQRMGSKDYPIPDNTEEDNWMYVDSTWAYKPLKPVLDDEPVYEGIPQGLHGADEPLWQACDVRRYAYWSVFAGSCGHTYGHSAIMQFYREGYPPAYFNKKEWTEALRDPGFNQMKYLKRLMLSFPYFERIPDQSIVLDNGTQYDRLAATRGSDYLLVYNYIGRDMTIDLRKISGARKNVWWMDARTGKLTWMGEYDNKIHTFRPPLSLIGKGIADGILIAIDSSKTYLSEAQEGI